MKEILPFLRTNWRVRRCFPAEARALAGKKVWFEGADAPTRPHQPPTTGHASQVVGAFGICPQSDTIKTRLFIKLSTFCSMIKTQFAQDLSLARIKTGFAQIDAAHLLDLSVRTIARYERGESAPDLTEIMGLSLIYGRSFESFFAEKLQAKRRDLRSRLRTLPDLKIETGTHKNRAVNLDRLLRRLDAEIDLYA
ncbi:helix-turn-helix domain-containing protein [Fluviibacterium sp. S390]|uniref:helix-turn-helix domain-containing protein n=1 Tax=Fluviibacterium sp. S390 TaxID=3415139 RepID=UPI003C7AB62B